MDGLNNLSGIVGPFPGGSGSTGGSTNPFDPGTIRGGASGGSGITADVRGYDPRDPYGVHAAAAAAAAVAAAATATHGYDPHPELIGSAGPWHEPGLFDDISFQNPFDSESFSGVLGDVGGVAGKLALALGVSLGIAQLILVVGVGLVGLAALKIYKD